MKKQITKKLMVLAFAAAGLMMIGNNVFASEDYEDPNDHDEGCDMGDGAGGGGDGDTYVCSSGGPGSTSCKTGVTATIKGTGGGTHCEVTCADGYYACCNAMHNKCQCRPY